MKNTQEKTDTKFQFLLTKFGIPSDFLTSKSSICRHQEGCIENILKTTYNSFKYGYVLRCIFSLLGTLMQIKTKIGKKEIKAISHSLIAKENWIFASFLASFPLINKTLICLLRKYRKQNCGFQDFVTGAIAGFLSLSILPITLRFILTLYLFTRALDSIYRYYLIKKGLKEGKYFYVLVLAICCGFIGYAFAFEPDLMPGSLVKIYLRFANMDKNDMIFRDAWIEMVKKKLTAK